MVKGCVIKNATRATFNHVFLAMRVYVLFQTHPQVIDHQEPVRLRDASVSQGLTASDQMVTVHVKIREDPRVGVECMHHFQVQRISQVNLAGGSVAATNETAVIPA